MILNLPYPPTTNTYYRKWNNRMVISARGREFAKQVAAVVGKVKPIADRASVTIDLYPPDKRKRDIDNTIKPIFDALTKAGVWVDDSQVDALSVVRNPQAKNKIGGCVVIIASQAKN